MTDFRELSRLPDDERYWDELEVRIVEQLAPQVRDRALPRNIWTPLARHAWELLAIGTATAAAVTILVPAPPPAPAATRVLLEPAESNPAWVSFIRADQPPNVTTLILPYPDNAP